MPIEGTNEESQEELKSESEVDSVMDALTESLEFAEDPDEYSLLQAKGLRNLALHIDWSVSIRKIVYRGTDDFKENLEKQFLRHMQAHLYDGLCKILKIKVSPIDAPYRKSHVQRRVKKLHKQAFAVDNEVFVKGLQAYAQEVGHDLPEDKEIANKDICTEELLMSFWFSAQVKKLAKKARHIGWMEFSPPEIKDVPSLINLCLDFEKQKEEREIIRLKANLKKSSEYDFPQSESFDASVHHSLIREREKIEAQLSLFEKVKAAQKRLPRIEKEDFPYPPFPLKELAVENYIDEVHLRFAEIQEQKEKKARILRLLRIALILIATVSFCIWQINLRYEFEDLKYRAAQVGLRVNAPLFPYNNQQIADIRHFVEKQENLSPKMMGIKKIAIKKGLKRIPFTPPYAEQQFLTWSKALDSFQLQRIPAGEMELGSLYGFVDERPMFTMSLSRDVFFMDGEVTQALYRAVMEKNPNVKESCLDCPVTNVRWVDAIEFANRLSSFAGYESCYVIKEGEILWSKGISCLGFRLPTEAEWEYAAKAQSSYTYSGSMDSSQVAWFNGNSGLKVQTVRTLVPNDFKLFDMNGNVWEWCWDKYGRYTQGVLKDPLGSSTGMNHVIRGGSYKTELTTVSARAEHDPEDAQIDIGFRLVRTAVVGNITQ